jgi:hypothetical protein
MAEQNLSNHTRIDPAYHYFVMPVLLVNLVLAIVRLVHPHGGWHRRGMVPHFLAGQIGWHLWTVVVALALLVLAVLARTYSLRVQDRIIRMEERIRMAALLPMEMQMLQRELSTRQIIALRFASDAELAVLVEQAVREKLTPKAIKQNIRNWRADTDRV